MLETDSAGPAGRPSGWVSLAWAAAFGYLGLTGDPPSFPDVAWDIDLAGHAVASLLLALLLAEWLTAGRGWSTRAGLIVAGVAALVYGLVIEVLQTARPTRSFEWPDLAADLVGAAAGALSYAWARRLLPARLVSRLLMAGGVLAVLATVALVVITA